MMQSSSLEKRRNQQTSFNRKIRMDEEVMAYRLCTEKRVGSQKILHRILRFLKGTRVQLGPAGSTTARWLSLLSCCLTTSKGEEMTLKSRWIGLVTILVLFAMAPGLFAQVQIQITPDVSSQEVQTNRNAQTARPGTNGAGLLVAGQVFAPSALTATTLRIAYPGPITAVPAGDGNTTPGLSGLGNGGSNCTDPSLTPSTFACAGG